MDSAWFIVEVFNDGQTVVTRLGYWRHFRDLETGEGRWVWDGPGQQQLTRAFSYPQREKEGGTFPDL